MKKNILASVWIALMLVGVVAPVLAGDDASVEQLIQRLGSADFWERESAMRRLSALEEVPAQLRPAVKSPDLEVRRRAIAIIREIEGRPAREGLAEARRLAGDGHFDEAAERIVRWSEFDPQGTSLQDLSQLAQNVIEAEQRRSGKAQLSSLIEKDMIPTLRVDRFKHFASRDQIACRSTIGSQGGRPDEHGRLALRGNGVKVKGDKICAFIVSSGEVAVSDCELMGCSIVFAAGSFDLEVHQHGIGDGVGLLIVSDGDVSIRAKRLAASLIIARGDVALPRSVFGSTVLAGGRVKQQGDHKDWRNCIIHEHDLDGLGLIKFFDPKKQGIEVTEAKEGVRVKAVAKGKPFAAVLRAGDVVSAVNGKPTASPEAFRKVLRAALAEERRLLPVTIRRSGETMIVRVPMKH